MARISASVYTSHVPAIGAALDLGKTHEPYWQKVFTGYEFSSGLASLGRNVRAVRKEDFEQLDLLLTEIGEQLRHRTGGDV